MIQKFEQYNESIRDKMIPKSESDISNIIDDNFIKLEELMQELFLRERWDDIKNYIEVHYDDIYELFKDGEWSLKDVYDEHKHKISNYLEDLDEDEDDEEKNPFY